MSFRSVVVVVVVVVGRAVGASRTGGGTDGGRGGRRRGRVGRQGEVARGHPRLQQLVLLVGAHEGEGGRAGVDRRRGRHGDVVAGADHRGPQVAVGGDAHVGGRADRAQVRRRQGRRVEGHVVTVSQTMWLVLLQLALRESFSCMSHYRKGDPLPSGDTSFLVP